MNVDNVGSLVSGAAQVGRSGATAAERATPVVMNTAAAPPVVPGVSTLMGRAVMAGEPSAEDLARIVADLQHRADIVAPEIRFAVNQSNGQTLIEVTDRTTNKVIRQIPSEEALQIARNIGEFQRHLLVDQEA